MCEPNSKSMKIESETNVKDFTWSAGLNKIGFSFIGVWPNFGSYNGVKISCAVLYIAITVVAPQMYSLTLSRKHFDLILEILLTNIECTATLPKLLTLWYSRTAMIPIMETCAKDWRTMTTTWQQEIMLKFGDQGRFLATFGYVFCALALFAYGVLPVLGLSMHSEVANITNANGRYLPLPTTYPYFFSASPYFELCYASQVAGGVVVCICLIGPVTLFGTTVLHVCGQIEILKVTMQTLSFRPTKKCKGCLLAINKDWHSKLGEIVKKHQDIIMTINNVENYFNLLIITEVITLPVTMCTVGYQIMNVMGNGNVASSKMGQYLCLFVTLAMVLLHVFVYCLVGEILAYYSNGLYYCVYDTKWYAYSKMNAKNLIPILVQTKDPLRLTAGKYIDLNLDTFCKVLKTVAGYISMLLAAADK